MNKNFQSIVPVSKNEMGLLKGGFSVYAAAPTEPVKTYVSVSVTGQCECKCEAASEVQP